MADRVYLDWNATAPLRIEAREAMGAAMDVVGNPSSVHAEGRAAKAIVEKARGQVAALVGCEPSGVVFTSGATEAAAMVLSGCARVFGLAVEHDCVTSWLTDFGSVDGNGRAEREAEFAVEEVEIACWQAGNSETGVLQDAPDCGTVQCLRDIVQVAGKLDRGHWPFTAQYGLVSAHKIGGPKGVGALIAGPGVDVPPMIRGGGQEMGRRSGTENVIGIAGFGAAAEAAQRDLANGEWDRVAEMRDALEAMLLDAAPELVVFGKDVPRLPNTSNFAIPGWTGETQVMQMDLAGFAVSAGSACSSGKVKESRVLRAMGFDSETASSAIRVSMGPTTSEAEVAAFADTWIDHYRRFKRRAA